MCPSPAEAPIWTYIGPTDGPANELLGIRLAQRWVATFRSIDLDHPRSAVPAEGPHFVYDRGPSLFLGRSGRGPLTIAWDTNLLIDYFAYGRRLWEDQPLRDELPADHAEELEALQILMGLWILRDIRFHILPGVIRDSRRKPLAVARIRQRERAWREFCRALSLLGDDDDGADFAKPPWPPAALRSALREVPVGNDRRLVEDAVNRQLHVFMTCDKDVLRGRPYLAAFGLLLASPQDMLEHVTAAGAMECMFHPDQLYWPMPDLQRVTHLVRALPNEPA